MTPSHPIRVGLAGASGYAGQELLRIASRHPGVNLTVAMGSGTASTPRELPALARIWDGEVLPLSTDILAREAEAVFLALPDATTAEVGPTLIQHGLRVFDLSGTFRLRNPSERERWYPATSAETAALATYGLTELYREAVRDAKLIACPGCYPTAAILALRPLAEADLLDGDVIIDAKSGVSGAGKRPSERTHFSECHGSVAAYGIFAHRHAAEIEQELQRPVTFVPHLVPLDRGIFETIYTRLRVGAGASDVATALEAAYGQAPFVRLTGDRLPEIKHVAHTNFCDIGWRLDPATNRLVMVACLDNLVKGAAGQAIQNFNVVFGYDERTGLV